MDKYIAKARELRKALHSCPETALNEHNTKAALIDYMKQNSRVEIIDMGAWFYAVHHGRSDLRRIALRADYDAVCIGDGLTGHYCGHDGHAAILAEFTEYVSDTATDDTVYFIFQPAEETGEGALLCRELIKQENISEIYGFHNIPGYPLGSILLLKGTFACASTGLEITLQGKPSHAAYPEAGCNPSYAAAKIIAEMKTFLSRPSRGMLLGTVIGVDIGSSAYGVSAGSGVLRLTLRGEYEDEFNAFTEHIILCSRDFSAEDEIDAHIREIERFPATENHAENIAILEAAALKSGLTVCRPAEPFRWSEDFGYYLRETKGAFFGVGDGENWPQLHTDAYCFNDEIIPYVFRLYAELL